MDTKIRQRVRGYPVVVTSIVSTNHEYVPVNSSGGLTVTQRLDSVFADYVNLRASLYGSSLRESSEDAPQGDDVAFFTSLYRPLHNENPYAEATTMRGLCLVEPS